MRRIALATAISFFLFPAFSQSAAPSPSPSVTPSPSVAANPAATPVPTPGNADAAQAASPGAADQTLTPSPAASPAPGPITWVAPRLDMRPTDLFARTTVQVIFNTDPAHVLDSGSSPILNMLGAGTVFPLPLGFGIAPSLDVFSTYYALVGGRAMPIEIENRTAVLWCLLLDIPVQYSLDLAEKHRLVFTAGPAFAIRFALRATAVPVEEQPAVDAIAAYLWSGGRFFYPEVGVSYSYKMADWVRFGVTAKVLLPVFNWWTGENLPFSDNLITGGGVWLSFTDLWRKVPSK